MSKKIYFVLLFSLLLSACGMSSKSATEITLVAQDFSYSPATMTVPAGESITLILKNDGKVQHDFVIEKINVTNVIEDDNSSSGHDMGHDMSGMDYSLHVSTMPGEASTIKFTPTEAGAYEIFCSVEGHKEAGMVGKLIVSNTQQ